MQYQCRPPTYSPSLCDMVCVPPQLGGFLARTGDGEPVITSIRQGYQRGHEFISTLAIPLTVNATEKCRMLSTHFYHSKWLVKKFL